LFSAFFESNRLGIWSTEDLKPASGHTAHQLRPSSVEMRVIDKRNGKGGNVDPRLISEAYRLLLIEKKAPANLVLVSGDKDYGALLVDYEKEGPKIAILLSTRRRRHIHRPTEPNYSEKIVNR